MTGLLLARPGVLSVGSKRPLSRMGTGYFGTGNGADEQIIHWSGVFDGLLLMEIECSKII